MFEPTLCKSRDKLIVLLWKRKLKTKLKWGQIIKQRKKYLTTEKIYLIETVSNIDNKIKFNLFFLLIFFV